MPAPTDAVDDGFGEIVIVEDIAPAFGRLVGGEDHRAASDVAVVDDVVEDVGGVVAVAEVSDSSTTSTWGRMIRARASRILPSRPAADSASMSSAAVVKLKSASKPFLHGAMRDRDGQLRLAAPRLALEDHRVSLGDEVAHLDADAEVDDGLGEGGVELLDLASLAALLDDGPGAVEDGHQGQPAEGDEVAGEAAHAHDRLDALVVDERDRDEARLLDPRPEEVNALPAPVDEGDVDVSEVVL
jgi:hypothetical protein